MKRKLPYSALVRVSRLLLLISVASLACTSAVVIYAHREQTELRRLREQLFGQVELQRYLLSSQPSDYSLYPHIEPDIGYVLNPHMGESTWVAASREKPYAINSIGLRGRELARKAEGTKRILLVGDSVLFGWKLEEEDSVANVMNRYLADRLSPPSIEVVTAALPGWNVFSQRAFVEAHYDLLDPDIIVWKLMRNDIEDVPGVIPPGILAAWNSPQKSGQVAKRFDVDFHMDLPVPTVLGRYDSSLMAIQTVKQKYDIPVVLIGLSARKRPLFERLLQRNGVQMPTVVVPDRFASDRRSWCISETDCHPSPWATRIIALGLLDRLSQLGWIPKLGFEEDEQAIVGAFRAEEQRRPSLEEQRRFAERQLSKVPGDFVAGRRESRRSVLYGLNADTGEALRSGVLVLQDLHGSTAVELDFEIPPGPSGSLRSVDFAVRSEGGDLSRRVIAGAERRRTVTIPLPEGGGGRVYELAWEFDSSSCSSPVRCISGTLHSVRFTTAEGAGRGSEPVE